MAKTLDIIRDEHRSIAAILHGMEYLVDRVRARKAKINPRVFRAMIYYLDTFSERMHHPKEDRFLFSALRNRGGEAATAVADLEREHAAGGSALRRLEQCLVRYEEGGDREFQAFADAVAKFIREYRDHMHKEESIVFPMAERMLSAQDWQAIDRAFAENRDPLAADRDTRDFEKLFDRIVNLAPPPIGVGPDI
ncbi:MAG TPA: hemerythrin domain-containing protein [Burkholderiales bacterium]|nr:hemerythrin domain-containing protein [Burkholderiales bacterium]